jgi:hypothetical protein
MGVGWTSNISDRDLIHSRVAHLSGAGACLLYQGLAKLSSSKRDALRVGVDRLNTAIKENSLVDKAIDLGIALEVMS